MPAVFGLNLRGVRVLYCFTRSACPLLLLTKLGLDKNHWTMRVKGIGSGYWRVVGELDELVDKAKEISQRTLFGIGFARFLNKA
jgi:hypothetical protein